MSGKSIDLHYAGDGHFIGHIDRPRLTDASRLCIQRAIERSRRALDEAQHDLASAEARLTYTTDRVEEIRADLADLEADLAAAGGPPEEGAGASPSSLAATAG